MATVVKTFTGGESLAESGLSADIDFGIGAAFSFGTLISDLVSESEEGIQGVGDTWETWGVPPGAIVTAIEAVYDRAITNSGGRVTDSLVVAKIINNSGVDITTNPIISNTSRTAGTSIGVAGTGQQAVLGSYQASNQGVRLYLINTVTSNSSTINWLYSIDNLQITITYTPAPKAGLFFGM